ncbi:phenylalanine 4-hydroxylase [Sediminitomix flava]|uniref:Phenylalanine-4-hydroxylase n=2 Tax=Sediminitomix flava TaxID=379075 RepID=A0A315ZTE9_SEDFL|nr:phenylalanine 4-hydroxylase [Sediminitomix flava]
MRQDYAKYTSEDLEVWSKLYHRQMKQLPGIAENAFLEGVQKIGFREDKIPNFEEMNKRLQEITGWEVAVVAGLIPNKEFFELLQNKKFPASTWFRKLEELDYLEEPDMFHDVFGHVPILTNHDFCGFLQGLSTIALRHIENEWIIELISRLYWYTVEFGLIETSEGLQVYGAGILSSSGESIYSIESDIPQRVPFDIHDIISTPYIKDRFQEKYWIITSYKQLFDCVEELSEIMDQIAEGSLVIESK